MENKLTLKRPSASNVTTIDAKELRITGFGYNSESETANAFKDIFYKIEYGGRSLLINRNELRADRRITSALDKRLLSIGYSLIVKGNRDAFWEIISQYEENLNINREADFFVAQGVGWSNGVYITPRNRHKATSKTVEIYDEDFINSEKWSERGTLAEWQKYIALPCGKHSPLLTFLICLAFVAPLLKLLGKESFAVNLVGRAQSGKTSGSGIAATVWGGGPKMGFLEHWKISDNGFEDYALEHRDAFLCLDDTSRIDGTPQRKAEILRSVAFGNEGGKEKKRKGHGRPAEWRTILLSTSNDSVAKMLSDGGQCWSEQIGSRFLEIEVPFNRAIKAQSVLRSIPEAFNLHREYIDEKLKPRSAKYYGTPIEAFLAELSRDWKNTKKCKELKAFVKKAEDAFRQHGTKGVQYKNMARSETAFALIYAAGRLAQKYKVLPWDTAVIQSAVSKMYRGHCKVFQKNGSLSTPNLVRAYITQEKSKFVDLSKGIKKMSDEQLERVLGFIRKRNGHTQYLIPKGRFEDEFCKVLSLQTVVSELQPFLEIEANGGRRKRTCKRVQIRSNSQRDHVYVIAKSILKPDA